MSLEGKRILITGAARRIGRHLAVSLADAGADIIIHYGHSSHGARQVQLEIETLGRKAWLLQADFNNPEEVSATVAQASQYGPLYAIINNAAIFEPLHMADTTLADWQRHLNINLTAPFLLCQAFARSLPEGASGRIINLLDWRALRPGADHFPYTISKAALASLTRAMAIALAPHITVNGIALGAILPPSDQGDPHQAIRGVPAGRWADLDEVTQVVRFLLEGPAYMTGDILYLDGGRHLT